MGGYAFAVARLNTPQALFVTVVGAMGVATIFFEVLRIRYKFWNKIFFAVLGRQAKPPPTFHLFLLLPGQKRYFFVIVFTSFGGAKIFARDMLALICF